MRTALFAGFLILSLGAFPAFASGNDCQQLSPPDPQPGEQFGCSVDLHGDSLVVGSNMGGAGSITSCHKGANGIWACDQRRVTPNDGQTGDQFGRSAGVDGNWLAVGAPFANGSGAVYLFRREDAASPWVQTQKIVASDAARGDQFGLTLALRGDLLIMGAPNNVGTGGSLSGAVYVFNGNGNTWAPGQKLTAQDARPFDNFGFSLATDGSTILVGAPFHDGSAGNSGAAYVFDRSSGSWSQQARLTASDGAADDEYGSAVSVSGQALVVGARAGDVNGMRDAGSAYVYEKSGGGWKEVTHLFGEAAGDRFGVAASMSGDRLVIGAMLHGGGNGAAYLFVRQANEAWTQDGGPIPGDAQGGRFGQAVSTDGGEALVGAYLARGTGSASVCPFPVQARSADLSLVTSGPRSIRPGQTIVHTLTVTNHGPDEATGVLLQERIPAGLQVVRSSLPAGCAVTEGAVVCTRAALAVGGDWSVSLQFKAQETCSAAIGSPASVSASERDPFPDNNSGQISSTVVRTANLTLEKTGPSSVIERELLPYELKVTNLGPDLACGVVLSDPIPAGLASPDLDTGCMRVGTEVQCPIGTLPVGATRVFILVFKAPEVGVGGREIVNTATVHAAPSTADPQPANDSETVVTQVSAAPAPKPAQVPALSGPALAALALLLALLALRRLRRRAL
jgi:uncharacterized repeat protein (TIGR01451 family)